MASRVLPVRRMVFFGLLGLACAAAPASAQPSYRVIGDTIPVPLAGAVGDARRGQAVAVNSSQGNCAICHRLPVEGVLAFGDVGPPLDGVGARLTPAQLRLRIVDAKRINPASIMPAYYKLGGLYRVAAAYRGRALLSAQEIEDVVAYLVTLR